MRIVSWNIENVGPTSRASPGLLTSSIAISPDLLPRLRTAEVLPRRPESDHAPVVLELD